MTLDRSSAATESPSSRKLTRKPALLAAAALIATGALGLMLGNSVLFASAETATQQQTIETPYGRAPLSFADLVAKVSPAVVSITTTSTRQVRGFGDMFPFEFGQRGGGRRGAPQEEQAIGAGSGFIIDKAGYILTNNHVIEDATKIEVQLANMKDGEDLLPAKVVGHDALTDTALLQLTELPSTPLTEIKFGDSSQLAPGDWVASARNVSQLDLAGYMARFRIEPVRSFGSECALPLRTTNPDAGAGFYTHHGGYVPFAFSRAPLDDVGLGRVIAVPGE